MLEQSQRYIIPCFNAYIVIFGACTKGKVQIAHRSGVLELRPKIKTLQIVIRLCVGTVSQCPLVYDRTEVHFCVNINRLVVFHINPFLAPPPLRITFTVSYAKVTA